MARNAPLEERSSQELKIEPYRARVDERVRKLAGEKFVERLWQKDPSLWKTDADHVKIIKNSLGWLTVAGWVSERLGDLKSFAESVKKDGFTDIALLGMGGSSLAPEVFRLSLAPKKGYPKLHVLDSTDPGWVAHFEKSLKLSKTLFVVASKSGTTIEPLSFYNYFYERAKRNGKQFVAITDPGSYLEGVAKEQGFRKIFVNPSDIGGRFSALSYFGIVPAALAGMDVEELLARAVAFQRASSANVPVEDNQAVVLGCVIGEAAKAGRDKVTLVLPKEIESFGLWVEQLVAESSGKEDRGIVPIAGENLGSPEIYGNDRLFVVVSFGRNPKPVEAKLSALERKHPVVRITIKDAKDLGAEMLRWEIATSVACSILGVNTFDQPDVQSAKDVAKSMLKDLAAKGSLPLPKVHLEGKKFRATFSDASLKNLEPRNGDKNLLQKFLEKSGPGDYFGILAYFPFHSATDKLLAAFRNTLRNGSGLATLFGYGPRYLHSTGQLHKGGDNNGIFIILTADPKKDLAVPEQGFTFGQLELAQALGDFQALNARKRRAVWIHVKGSVEQTLDELIASIKTEYKD